MALIECNECGKSISDKAEVCPSCGYSKENTQVTPTQPDPILTTARNDIYVESHLAKAILVTIFCCLPFGIVAIVNAASVNGKLQAGDVISAKLASDNADKYANWSIIGGALAGIIWFFIVIAGSH